MQNQMTFCKSHIARAYHAGSATVSSFTFGQFSRFCAKLCQTRFGEPAVFIHDADQHEDDAPTLTKVIWQGKVSDLATGVAFAERLAQ